MSQTPDSATLLSTIRHDPDLLDVGRAFRALVRLRDEAEVSVAIGVRAMRKRQASWTEIGNALGVSKQAAQQRYGN